MQPRSIGAEQYFARASSLHSLLQQIESAHPGGIGINVAVAGQVINERHLGLPIIGEATKVGNDEINVRVFAGEQFTHRNFTHDVIEDWQREYARGLAYLTTD